MLNIPTKSQLSQLTAKVEPIKQYQSKLEQLVLLRKQMKELEYEIEEIMPDSINEALTIMENEQSINGKNLVFASKYGSITVSFRKKYPNNNDNITLKRLDEDIKAEQQSLALTHQPQLKVIELAIDKLNNELAVLEQEQEKLLTSERLIKLKARFKQTLENLVELIPSLSVYLK
jgi:CHAD domain-containing protein